MVALASGCVRDLGLPQGYDAAAATALAPNGLVAGYAQKASGLPYLGEPVGFLLDGGSYTILPTPDGYAGTSPADVNSSGTIVGYVSDRDRHHAAFVWTRAAGSQVLPVGDLATANVFANAVNDAGEVVGVVSPRGSGAAVAFLWGPGGALRELPPLPGMTSAGASDVNEEGTVLGSNSDGNGSYPVVWEPPLYEPVALPTPPGHQWTADLSIDEDGGAVGLSRAAGTTTRLLVRWSGATGHPYTVIPHDEELFEAEDIDGGAIVGTAGVAGDFHAALVRAGSTELEGLGSIDGANNRAYALSGTKVVGMTQTADSLSHVAEFTFEP